MKPTEIQTALDENISHFLFFVYLFFLFFCITHETYFYSFFFLKIIFLKALFLGACLLFSLKLKIVNALLNLRENCSVFNYAYNNSETRKVLFEYPEPIDFYVLCKWIYSYLNANSQQRGKPDKSLMNAILINSLWSQWELFL